MLWKDCGCVEGPVKDWGTAALLGVSGGEPYQEAWLEDSASCGYA